MIYDFRALNHKAHKGTQGENRRGRGVAQRDLGFSIFDLKN
jgi:hypothetical protein